MYTIQYDFWEPSKYPPPLRPLPPIPQHAYLTPTKSSSTGSLLFHPVPSPSLRFKMPDLENEVSSCNNSAQLSCAASSNSSRNSISSLVEFTEALLPPPPQPSRSIRSIHPVRCYLQDPPYSYSDSSSTSPGSRRGATPIQLNQLCSEFGSLQMERRDSAMFDITQAARSSIRKGRSEIDMQNNSSAMPALIHAVRMKVEPEDYSVRLDQQQHPVALPQVPSVHSAESSFMDWDEELPRLAKVKKSIADLKAVARSRTHPAPTAPVEFEMTQDNTHSSLHTGTDITTKTNNTDSNIYSQARQHSSTQLGSVTSIGRRKSSRRRTAISFTDNSKRVSYFSRQKSCLSNTNPASSISKRKRVSFVGSSNPSSHRRGLSKVADWVMNAIRCS